MIVPIVQEKLLATEPVSGTVNTPQVVADVVDVNAGVGNTVTVINAGDVGLHEPIVEVGITE